MEGNTMIKKIMLLASMALATAALAAPAAQAEWLHNGAPLKANATVNLSGTAGFAAPFGLGTYTCTVHATLVAEPGSTGKVTKFEPTTNTCVGTGILANCKLKSHSSNVPMIVHANTTVRTISITNATIKNVYEGANCSQTETHLLFSTVTATPDNGSSISSVKLSGTATNGTTVSGTLNVTPAKTYGIK